MSRYLFINGSANRNGRTARMATELMNGHEYETLDLVDMRIAQYGQSIEGDQFMDVIEAMRQADVVVMGSPVYWHTMGGLLKTVLDRLYELYGTDPGLGGKQLALIFQGAAPTKLSVENTVYIFERVAEVLGMEFAGAATNESELNGLRAKLK